MKELNKLFEDIESHANAIEISDSRVHAHKVADMATSGQWSLGDDEYIREYIRVFRREYAVSLLHKVLDRLS